MVRFVIMILPCLLFAHLANADILFEGYSKIMSGDQQIGYVVSKFEFDAKKKQFSSAYFLKTVSGGVDVTESLKAFSDSELTPISYEYTSVVGKETKTIDAKFKKDNMTATVKSGGKIQRIDKKIPKGTFLSTFLVYLMLKSKDGLKSESNYEYQAIAEEDGTIAKGQALVSKEEVYAGHKAFKILNTFKDMKFLSYVNERGEVLGTVALGQGISTELMPNAAEATKGFPVSTVLLKAIFGSVPEGKDNVVSRAARLKENQSKVAPPTKENLVPPGQGIIIKAGPEAKGTGQ